MICQKSAIRTYNNAPQTVSATATQLLLAGTTITRTGCSIAPEGNLLRIGTGGLYYISTDVTFTPTAAGTVTVQLYLNDVAMPDAIVQQTVAAGSPSTLHAETVRLLSVCPCANRQNVSVRISGAAGTVSWVGASVIREA